MEDSFYLVYLKGGHITKANSLEDIKHLVPDTNAIECIMFAQEKEPNYGWYRVGFVDIERKPITFGYFRNGWKVSSIDRLVNKKGYATQSRITLTQGHKYYNYILKDNSPKFIFNEIKPLIEKLDKCDTDDEIADILGKPQPTIEDLQRENLLKLSK